MSIVVVEGPDGSGKSTLIKNLREDTSRYYVSLHNAGPPQDVLNVQCITNWIAKMAVGRVPLVCDRISLISEPIYGQVLRNENILEGSYTTDDIKDFFVENVDRVIYCRPPTAIIHKGLLAEKQLRGVADRIEDLTQCYDHIMRLVAHWGVRVITYDWTGVDMTKKFGGTPRNLDDLFFGECYGAR